MIHPPQATPVHYSGTRLCARQLQLEAATIYSRLLLLRQHTQTQYHSARPKRVPLLEKRPAGHQICLLQVLRSKSVLRVMALDTGHANVQPKAEKEKAENPGIQTQYHQTPAGHAQGNTIGCISTKRALRGEPRGSAYCAERTTTGSKSANCTTLRSTEAKPEPRDVLAQGPSEATQRGACDTEKQATPPRRVRSAARQSLCHLRM